MATPATAIWPLPLDSELPSLSLGLWYNSSERCEVGGLLRLWRNADIRHGRPQQEGLPPKRLEALVEMFCSEFKPGVGFVRKEMTRQVQLSTVAEEVSHSMYKAIKT